jgi:CheY-like chemotaxis protein
MEESERDPICLIVEDSEFDRRLIARSIRRSGLRFRVRAAHDIASARAAFGHPGVQALVLDNSLPDGRGVDLALRHANDPWFIRLAKVLVTDLPSPFMWEKARAAGVDQVMMKSELSASTMRSALTAPPTSRLTTFR